MNKILRKSSYLRLLIPAALTALLVFDGLMGYVAPEIPDSVDIVTQTSYAAEAPELETIEQAEHTTPQPQGTAGKLAAVKDPENYKDGTYTGSARGFGGTITVRVTIKNGKIASIIIVSAAGETSSFIGKAKAVIGRILNKQSTNVDAVSGATYSSNGIIKAVRNALAKASGKKSGSDKKTYHKDKSGKTSKQKPKKPKTITNGNWKDGTYTGEGEGFSGKLHVEVTIEGGRIVSVKLLDTKDDNAFMNKAKAGVLKSVVDKQSTDVDAVTGATYSSYGLIEAINDALKKAALAADDAGEGTDTGKGGGTGEGGNTGDGSETGNQDDPESETKGVSMTAWVYYDEDEDFDDYQITVTFSSVNGKITAIKDYSQTGSASNNRYIKNAVQGINGQLSSGKDASQVDTITGATCTSSAIIGMMSGAAAGERQDEDDSEKGTDTDVAGAYGDTGSDASASTPNTNNNEAGEAPASDISDNNKYSRGDSDKNASSGEGPDNVTSSKDDGNNVSTKGGSDNKAFSDGDPDNNTSSNSGSDTNAASKDVSENKASSNSSRGNPASSKGSIDSEPTSRDNADQEAP